MRYKIVENPYFKAFWCHGGDLNSRPPAYEGLKINLVYVPKRRHTASFTPGICYILLQSYIA